MGNEFIYRRSTRVRWIFAISLLTALVLDSFVLSLKSSTLFPAFSLLIIFYWAGHFLDRSYIATAFVMGLLVDTLYQTSLGAHAMIFVTLVFILSRHRLHFKSFTYWQQAIFVSGYFVLYQMAVWLFFSPALDDTQIWYFWLMPISSALSWLLIAPLFNRFTLQVEQH